MQHWRAVALASAVGHTGTVAYMFVISNHIESITHSVIGLRPLSRRDMVKEVVPGVSESPTTDPYVSRIR